MIILTIIKYICLFFGILYGFSNVVKAFRSLPIHAPQLWIMALGIVGYVLLEFELGC
jgi:hypothetical protein